MKNLFFLFFSFLSREKFPAPPFEQKVVEIRKITPPRLSKDHLGKQIVCLRPGRKGPIKLDLEKKHNKIIINNYGHGGDGWTLAPGSSFYGLKLLNEELKNSKLNKKTPITIIGAGVMGLFSAFHLLENGFTNLSLVAQEFENLTSYKAGGLFRYPKNRSGDQKLIDELFDYSYFFYKKIAQQKNNSLKEGVKIMPAYYPSRELNHQTTATNQTSKEVLLDFGNGKTQKMFAYDESLFMDVGKLMQLLYEKLKGKVKFEKRKINSFKEIKDPIIFNCSALGAESLSRDKQMVPIEGHIILLKNQNPAWLNYMVLYPFGKSKNALNFEVDYTFYFIPKHQLDSPQDEVGVIGGTYIEGADFSSPNDQEFEEVLKNARSFYGLLDEKN